MISIFRWIATALLLIMVGGCDLFSQPPNTVKHEADAAIVAAHNRLGSRLFAELADGSRNVVMSPVSIALALSMTQNGAAGETEQAMVRAMQLADLIERGLSEEDWNRSNLALIDSLLLASADDDIRLKVANALWHRNGLTIAPEFAATTRRFYRAEPAGLDFSRSESVDIVNAWARESTEGLIPQIVDELSGDLAALIANAVYFQGDWQTPFDERLTEPLPFHVPSGARPLVPTMYRSGSIEYFESDFRAIRLPYGETGRMAMYVFLPRADERIESFAKRFEEVAAEALGNFTPQYGDVWLPRLDVAIRTTLNEALKRLGMEIAFDPAAADFGRMITGAGPGALYIGDVLHQAVLQVDETGTTAAAVTTVEVRLTSAPARSFAFRADRPFLFAIRDDVTGALLFTGAIVDPTH